MLNSFDCLPFAADDSVLSFVNGLFYDFRSATNPAFTFRDGNANPFRQFTQRNLIAAVYPSFMRSGEMLYLVIGSCQHYTSSGSAVIDGKLFYLRMDNAAPRLYQKKVDSSSDPFFDITENLVQSHGNNWSPVFHDLNSDGVIDVMLGTRTAVHMMVNTGTTTHPIFLSAPLFPGTLTSNETNSLTHFKPAVADINGDSLPDLFIGTQDASLLYYENMGSPTSPQFEQREGPSNPMNGAPLTRPEVGGPGYTGPAYIAPVLVDLNGDQLIDLVLGFYCPINKLQYWKNIGTLTQPNFSLMTGTSNPFADIQASSSLQYVNTMITPTFYDLNDDGVLDLVAGSYEHHIVVYLNTGTKTNPIFQWEMTASQHNPFLDIREGSWTSPALYDIDNDGDVDLVFGTYLSHLYYFEANGCIMTSTCNGRGICQRQDDGTAQCACTAVGAGVLCQSCAAGSIEATREGGISLAVPQNPICDLCQGK
jgi:hypothetical protein